MFCLKYGKELWKTFLSLLLLFCFAAGSLLSYRRGCKTYTEWNSPYRDQELASLENILTEIANGPGRLLQYQDAQTENRRAADTLSEQLSELKAQQTQEILEAVYNSDRFDLDEFFHRDLFSHAYQDYMQDLLDAFKADPLLDSWLYSYYETTKQYGGNDFLDTDMWIYNGSGGNKFSPDLASAAGLVDGHYDLDLYEHILYTGHIYITGADFMREILSLPRYIADGAVFAKAFGGAEELSVPGWDESHREEFWLYGVNYYHIDTPIWLNQGFRAESFHLDWNGLINEPAFYDAYRNFMDKIAPGLPCYEMAVYRADNMAYGGMGYDLKGREASFREIYDAYAESHPSFRSELMTDKRYSRLLTTSVDEEIAGIEAQLEELEDALLNLQDQEKELSQLLEDADLYRGSHALLLADIEQHTQKLTNLLWFLSGTALLCAFAALLCLCRFMGLLTRLRHLFLSRRQDSKSVSDMGNCPKEQIADPRDALTPESEQAEDP